MAGLRVESGTVERVNALGERLAKELGVKRVSQDYVITHLLDKPDFPIAEVRKLLKDAPRVNVHDGKRHLPYAVQAEDFFEALEGLLDVAEKKKVQK